MKLFANTSASVQKIVRRLAKSAQGNSTKLAQMIARRHRLAATGHFWPEGHWLEVCEKAYKDLQPSQSGYGESRRFRVRC